jgi:hypothetical protein
MILFLDDSSARAVLAYNRMPVAERDNTIWCKSAEEAITTLWDYRDTLTKVYLDHDLGGEQYVNTKREDCGMEVVRYLEGMAHKHPEEFNELKDVKVVVHSWNTHAGPIMQDRLSKLGLKVVWTPFGM